MPALKVPCEASQYRSSDEGAPPSSTDATGTSPAPQPATAPPAPTTVAARGWRHRTSAARPATSCTKSAVARTSMSGCLSRKHWLVHVVLDPANLAVDLVSA